MAKRKLEACEEEAKEAKKEEVIARPWSKARLKEELRNDLGKEFKQAIEWGLEEARELVFSNIKKQAEEDFKALPEEVKQAIAVEAAREELKKAIEECQGGQSSSSGPR